MAYTSRIAWETLRSLDSATLAGAYVAVGGPLLHPAYIIKLVNNSNILVTISIDGLVDVDVAPANSFWLYDEGKVGQSSAVPALPAGTQILVKSATGGAGVGLIYLVSQYIITNQGVVISQAGINNVAGGGGGGSPVQTLTGNTGGAVPPTANNINVVGTGAVTVTGSPGTSTLTISVQTDSFTWSDKAISFAAQVQNGYFCTAALTATLPSAALVNGSTIILYIDTPAAVIIQAAGGQQIEISGTTSSVAGTATSTTQGNIVTLIYRVSDTTWHSVSSQGSFTLAQV